MTRSTSGSSRYCRRARRTSGSIPSRWRASITGQPVHLQSPLVPAILLLVSLASVNLGDHHRKVLWRAAVVSLVMLGVGMLTGAIPFFVAS